MNTGAWGNFLFGLFFGLGFICAYGVLLLVVWLVNMIASGAHSPLPMPGKQ